MRVTNEYFGVEASLECKGGEYASSPQGNGLSGDQPGQKKSFRQARKIRKRIKTEQILSRALVRKQEKLKILRQPLPSPGPTRETRAKLQPDPLTRLYKNGTLSKDHMAAAQKIRRAFELITAGANIRLTGYSEVIVQTSRRCDHYESDHEVMLKGRYTDWVDDMTAARLAVGPIFDIVIEEMSLSSVDRKWRRRKGWACTHLKEALALYLYPDYDSIKP